MKCEHPLIVSLTFPGLHSPGPCAPVGPLARTHYQQHWAGIIRGMNYNTSCFNGHGFVMCESVKMLSLNTLWSGFIVFWFLCFHSIDKNAIKILQRKYKHIM